ncbi:MAG: HAD family phosphatase [Saprospiraceae bacterium]
MRNIKGIVFDLDGTLVDSEPLHGEAWLRVLSDQGLVFEWEWFEQWIGTSDRYLAENVISEFNLNLQVTDLQLLKRNTYYALVAKELKVFPGVMEALQWFTNQVPLAIATSSSKPDVAAVLGAVPLAPFFQTIVHADHVMPNLKPCPDPYLLAAERIGLDPAAGLAMEDSVAGVKAAKAAGFFTLAVCNSHSAADLQEADLVFENTKLGMDWIRREMGGQ